MDLRASIVGFKRVISGTLHILTMTEFSLNQWITAVDMVMSVSLSKQRPPNSLGLRFNQEQCMSLSYCINVD